MPKSASVARRAIRHGRLAVLALALAPASPEAAEGGPSGPARAIDGMTLVVGETTVRLFGIAAPNLGQTCARGGRTLPCGDIARTALADLVAGSTVACTPVAAPTAAAEERGPLLARCSAGGFDIGANMVHTGWALADPDAAPARYRETEARARARRVGLWRTTFVPPWQWRQRPPSGPAGSTR